MLKHLNPVHFHALLHVHVCNTMRTTVLSAQIYLSSFA